MSCSAELVYKEAARSLGWLTRVQSSVLQSFYKNLKSSNFGDEAIIVSVVSNWSGDPASRVQQVIQNSRRSGDCDLPENYSSKLDGLYAEYMNLERSRGREVSRPIVWARFLTNANFVKLRFGNFAMPILGV